MGTDKSAYGRKGNTRTEQVSEKRRQRQEARNARTQVTIADIDANVLLMAIGAVVEHDGALRIGVSRDGGAWSFGIYGDGDPYTEYVPGTEDVNEYLRGLAEYFSS